MLLLLQWRCAKGQHEDAMLAGTGEPYPTGHAVSGRKQTGGTAYLTEGHQPLLQRRVFPPRVGGGAAVASTDGGEDEEEDHGGRVEAPRGAAHGVLGSVFSWKTFRIAQLLVVYALLYAAATLNMKRIFTWDEFDYPVVVATMQQFGPLLFGLVLVGASRSRAKTLSAGGGQGGRIATESHDAPQWRRGQVDGGKRLTKLDAEREIILAAAIKGAGLQRNSILTKLGAPGALLSPSSLGTSPASVGTRRRLRGLEGPLEDEEETPEPRSGHMGASGVLTSTTAGEDESFEERDDHAGSAGDHSPAEIDNTTKDEGTSEEAFDAELLRAIVHPGVLSCSCFGLTAAYFYTCALSKLSPITFGCVSKCQLAVSLLVFWCESFLRSMVWCGGRRVSTTGRGDLLDPHAKMAAEVKWRRGLCGRLVGSAGVFFCCLLIVGGGVLSALGGVTVGGVTTKEGLLLLVCSMFFHGGFSVVYARALAGSEIDGDEGSGGVDDAGEDGRGSGAAPRPMNPIMLSEDSDSSDSEEVGSGRAEVNPPVEGQAGVPPAYPSDSAFLANNGEEESAVVLRRSSPALQTSFSAPIPENVVGSHVRSTTPSEQGILPPRAPRTLSRTPTFSPAAVITAMAAQQLLVGFFIIFILYGPSLVAEIYLRCGPGEGRKLVQDLVLGCLLTAAFEVAGAQMYAELGGTSAVILTPIRFIPLAVSSWALFEDIVTFWQLVGVGLVSQGIFFYFLMRVGKCRGGPRSSVGGGAARGPHLGAEVERAGGPRGGSDIDDVGEPSRPSSTTKINERVFGLLSLLLVVCSFALLAVEKPRAAVDVAVSMTAFLKDAPKNRGVSLSSEEGQIPLETPALGSLGPEGSTTDLRSSVGLRSSPETATRFQTNCAFARSEEETALHRFLNHDILRDFLDLEVLYVFVRPRVVADAPKEEALLVGTTPQEVVGGAEHLLSLLCAVPGRLVEVAVEEPDESATAGARRGHGRSLQETLAPWGVTPDTWSLEELLRFSHNLGDRAVVVNLGRVAEVDAR